SCVRIGHCLEIRKRSSMKRLFVFSITIVICLISEAAFAQTACDLTSWMKSLPAHTQRTPELPATALRDTVIQLGGSSHKISLPPGFTMTVFANLGQCRGLAWSPDSVLYATSYRGTIYALPDHNHDGVPDSIIPI